MLVARTAGSTWQLPTARSPGATLLHEKEAHVEAVAGATNRALAYVALGSVVVIVALQALIFGIWGQPG